ncbi:DUF4113 domain-containing protein [Pseudomonas syringae group sp. J254-4]
MDQVNVKWGRGTVHAGHIPVTPDWGMKHPGAKPHLHNPSGSSLGC